MNLLKTFFTSKLFINEHPSNVKLAVAGILFLVLTPLILWFDSTHFESLYFEGRWLANVGTSIYLFWLFTIAGTHLRKLLFTMVIVSYIGELIFSTMLGMYYYRTPHIPLYVPLGHAIVYASGAIYAQTNWALRNVNSLKKLFPPLFIGIFLVAVLFFNDLFTLIFSFGFFWILKRKKWDNLYYFIALCVIFIELIGTGFQCWKWVPHTFSVIPAANPPMGAVFFYAGGDVLIGKIVRKWEKSVG